MLNGNPPHSKSKFENCKNTKKIEQFDLFSQPPLKLEKKKTNVADTSILAYLEEKAKGRFSTLSAQTKQLLASGTALTSRQISQALKVERNSITAPIKLLEESREIVIAYLAKCDTTGKTVRHYKLAGHD